MLRIHEFVRRHQLARFRIDEATVRTVVTHPDRRSVVSGPTGRVTIARRRIGEDLRVLAVVLEGKGGAWTVVGAFPLPRSVPELGTPLDSLAALCAGFGVPLDIGGLHTTLIVDGWLDGGPRRHLKALQRARRPAGRRSTELGVIARMARRGVATHVLLLGVIDLAELARALERDRPAAA